MPLPDPAPQRVRAPLTDAIVRHRNVLWGTLVVVYLLAFNGTWRVGRDSALYRGLADSLANGHGYTFGEFGSRQIYPGLPVLLAGLQKLFGRSDLPPILLIHAFAFGALLFTYKLVRLRYPQWVATIVTFAVGINGWFLELTNEIRDDVPFLFGMLMALYGWERLRIAILERSAGAAESDAGEANPPATAILSDAAGAGRSEGGGAATDVVDYAQPRPASDRADRRRDIFRSLIYLFVGLAIAAVMRPTFWILAIAWVLVCIRGLVAGPRRRFYALCLGVLLLVWAAMALADPRVRGFNPLQGGYERDAMAALQRVSLTLGQTLPKMLRSEFAYGFFGQQWVPGVTQLMSLVAIFASLLLFRRNPLWTLLVLMTVAVTLLMAPIPRYYVMVLPLLMLAWVLLSSEVALRVPHRWLEVALLAGICAVCVPNFVRCCKVIGEQRGWNRSAGDAPKWQYVVEMSRAVKELVPPGEKVIAPGATIMSYLSGREVVMQRDILPASDKKKPHQWPAHLAALNIRYAVFPSRLYKEGERSIRELMDRGVIVPVERKAVVGDMVLARVEVVVPPPGKNWKDQPVSVTPFTKKTTAGGTTRPSAAKLAKKKRQLAAARREKSERKAFVAARQKKQIKLARQQRQVAAEKQAKKLKQAAQLRKQRRAAAARRAAKAAAATQPVTQPATRPNAAPATGPPAPFTTQPNIAPAMGPATAPAPPPTTSPTAILHRPRFQRWDLPSRPNGR
ncbi:MAG TPA: hypothetical protein VER17_20875 [Tepidisphaeraceae bacterium]|nr:hypothetical protein [Tepidisphaeraceae bacterium]